MEHLPILVIDFNRRFTECHRCGKETPLHWGLPVDAETGDLIPDWFEPEAGWAGVPACEECYLWHARRSDDIHRPFEAPLV